MSENPPGHSREHGVAAVEMALVLPILVMVVFAIINFAAVLYDYIVITNAAREGARWASINTYTAFSCSSSTVGTNDPCEVANSYAADRLLNFGPASQPLTTASGSGSAGSLVTVTVTYSFKGVGWFLSDDFDDLSATSIMNHE